MEPSPSTRTHKQHRQQQKWNTGLTLIAMATPVLMHARTLTTIPDKETAPLKWSYNTRSQLGRGFWAGYLQNNMMYGWLSAQRITLRKRRIIQHKSHRHILFKTHQHMGSVVWRTDRQARAWRRCWLAAPSSRALHVCAWELRDAVAVRCCDQI